MIRVVRRDELTGDDYRALAEFRRQIRAFLHFSEDAARAAGLNPQQHQLLLALKGIHPDIYPSVNEVAQRLHIRHHSTVELTDRLAARGFIRKRQDGEDRRRVRLEITARGEAVLRKLSLIHREQLESAGKDLIRALRKLLNNNEGNNDKTRTRKNNRKRTR